MTLLIMPSVVSMPPNMITAAFEMTSAVVSAGAAGPAPLPPRSAAPSPPGWLVPAAAARSDGGSPDDPIAVASRALSDPNAPAPAARASSLLVSAREPSPPVIADTDPTIAAYQPSTVAGSVSPRPSASATTATASGPARPRRRSAAPSGRMAATRRSACATTNPASRAWIPARPKPLVKGPRWRPCAAPSRDSMLGPTTRAVENLGSSTVKAALSRMTATARSCRVTSQPVRAGSQETGSVSRRRASQGCGSWSRSARVMAAPSGNRPGPEAGRAPPFWSRKVTLTTLSDPCQEPADGVPDCPLHHPPRHKGHNAGHEIVCPC